MIYNVLYIIYIYNYISALQGRIQDLKQNGTMVSILDGLKAGVSASEARAPRLLGTCFTRKAFFRHHEIIFGSFLLEKVV